MANDNAHGMILSLGSVNADFQVCVDQQPGKATLQLGSRFSRLSGGKAANVACLACRLGAAVRLIAHVGGDDLQRQALGPLQDMGIDLRYVKTIDEASTGFAMIMVPPDGKKTIVLATNANDAWRQEDMEEVRQAVLQAPEGSVLVVDHEVPAFIVEQAINTAHAQGFAVVLDPSPADRVDQRLFSKVSHIVPDASETESLTGIFPDTAENAARAARKLVQQGMGTALVKLEDGGCVLFDGTHCLHVPVLELSVVDTTGAGDAFAAALATALLEKRSPPEAACFAAAAAQAAVTGYGSQPAYPDREELLQLVQRLGPEVRRIDL